MDDLSPREKTILDLIAADPFVGQAEIAARLGLARATVAAHIVSLVRKGRLLGRGYVLPRPKRIVCLGAAVVDRKYHARADLVPGTSNPVRGMRSFGGVARNVAENLVRLGVSTSLVTMVGDDENGRAILRHLRDLGVDTSQVIVDPERATGEYAAILDRQNNLALGIADMGIFDHLGLERFEGIWPHLAAASFVFADCNLPAPVLAALLERAERAGFALAVDTVSAPKAGRLPADLTGLDILFVNRDEAPVILGARDSPEAMAKALLARGARRVVLTMGAEGAIVATREAVSHVPAVPAEPLDVTGAGDAMIAGTLHRLLAGDTLAEAARVGALLATLTAESEATVLPTLSARFLEQASAAGR